MKNKLSSGYIYIYIERERERWREKELWEYQNLTNKVFVAEVSNLW